jgi:hypothetical protein
VEPVRVNLYGLFPMTRRRYVMQLVAAGVLVVVFLAAWLFYGYSRGEKMRQFDDPSLAWWAFLIDLTPWAVLVIALLQTVEAIFVLRAFARKQAQAQAGAPEADAPGAP